MTDAPLLDRMVPPPVIRKVDRDAPTIPAAKVDETLRLDDPRNAWPAARIQLHLDRASGLWMWSTVYNATWGGGGHDVGTKWNKFAETRSAALHWAVTELFDRLSGYDTHEVRRIRTWAEGLS